MTSIPPREKAEVNTPLLSMAADIVSAYITNNAVPASELPALIKEICSNLGTLAAGKSAVEAPKEPAVPVKKSVTPDFIICLEDGMKFKSLKRHLSSAYGLSPQEYRTKWGLPNDYPMVAASYSTARSAFAKQTGFGQKAPEVSKPKTTKKASAKKTA